MIKYKLTITPALESQVKHITFSFETAEQMVAAKDCCADLLIFIQDSGLMEDYSNIFFMEELVDDEWEEYEPFDI